MRSPVIQLQCRDCIRRGRCASELTLHRETLFLWARGAEPLRCVDYREDVMVATGYVPRSPMSGHRAEIRIIR